MCKVLGHVKVCSGLVEGRSTVDKTTFKGTLEIARRQV